MQETQILSLGWEDPLEMGMATLSSILAWRIPWTEDSGGLQSRGSQRVGHNWATNTSLRAAFCLHLTTVKCLSLLILQEIAWLFFLYGGLTELLAGFSPLSMCNSHIISISIQHSLGITYMSMSISVTGQSSLRPGTLSYSFLSLNGGPSPG